MKLLVVLLLTFSGDLALARGGSGGGGSSGVHSLDLTSN